MIVRLLMTRPMPESERTAQELRARGHEVLLAPMLEIVPLPDARFESGPYAAVLMTSGNAARAVAEHPGRAAIAGLHCFVVGRKTAEAARLAGFSQVHSADGDAGDLARLAAREIADPSRPLLYLAGDDRARDMDAEMAPAGLRVSTVVVYRAVAAKAFAPAIVEAMRQGAIDGVLHYSRRSTAIFVACVRDAGLVQPAAGLRHYCLSRRASEPLAEIDAGFVSVALRPDETSMIDLLR